MPMIDFTQDDLNRGKIVEPGWYILEIGNLEEKTSTKGDSTNWTFEDSKVVANAETGSTEFAGVPLAIRFNSKAKGFMIGFFSALLGEEVQPGQRFDLNAAVGKRIIANVINDTYDGRVVNKVDHKYRSYKG